jgi:type VI secretion system protein
MTSTLKLTVVSYAGESRSGPSKRFASGRSTIGRGTDNDWILPDPEKHLSSHHCIIEQQGAHYVITDVSRNGVYLNNVERPLGNGSSSVLTDGDLIAIGDYQLRIEIEGSPQHAAALAPNFGDRNPFGTGSAVVGDPFGSRGGSPPPMPPVLPSQPSPPGFAPFEGGPFGLPPEAATPPRFGGLEQGRGRPPDPDHVAAVDTFFRAPEVREPIIPPDWNPLAPEASPAPAAPNDQIVSPPPPARPAAALPQEAAQSPRAAVAATPVGPSAPDAALDAVRAFFEGAGLSYTSPALDNPAERMRRCGELFRELVSGIRDLLATRTMMKSEFRLEQTVIRPTANNPLKFSVDLDQALSALLLPQRFGYAEPLPATREAIADLKAHEIALIAGMQAAVAKLLAGLAPAEIERRIEAAGLLAAVLPAARKARYWEAYEKIYQQVSVELREDVRGVFQQSFAEAYSEQVKKL